MSNSRREKKTPSKLRDFHLGHFSVISVRAGKAPSNRNVNSKMRARLLSQSLFTKKAADPALLERLNITNMDAKKYIRSQIDMENLVAVKDVNVLNGIRAQGLFATAFIKQGTCIGEFTGKHYTEEDFVKYLEENDATAHYAISTDSGVIDSADCGNYTRFINFSDTRDNVKFMQSNRNGVNSVRVVALRNIQAGEQFLVDYNVYDDSTDQYLFVNPSDNHLSTYEVYQANRANYDAFTVNKAIPYFHLKRKDKLYLPEFAKSILNNTLIEDDYEKFDAAAVNLPIMKADAKNHLLEFNEYDVVSPLMLACYLCQPANVYWLLRNGAEVNQQQHQSGRYPLVCALAAYQAADEDNKPTCFEIMRKLIQCGASVTMHDRDGIAFILAARTVLSQKHFTNLLSCVRTNRTAEYNKLLQYVDKNEDDLIAATLRSQDFELFTALLQMFPQYLQSDDADEHEENTAAIKEVVADLSDADKQTVITSIAEAGIKLDQVELESLGLKLRKRRCGW